MTTVRREADRLNSYLDSKVTGGAVDPADLDIDTSLIETWAWATLAMAKVPSESIAASETWRTIMRAQSIATTSSVELPHPGVRQGAEASQRHWSDRALALVGVAALAAGLAVGIAGYDRFSNGRVPSQQTSIPAASFMLPGTPQATGCDFPRRSPGSIERIMETPPSRPPHFPRLNQNPLTEPMKGVGDGPPAVDGTSLWLNSSPESSVLPQIQGMLDNLYDCRAFAVGPDGQADMEGPYFSYFSDDYFRRELNGFVQAGLPLRVNAFWLPSIPPVALDVRRLNGGGYLVVLDETLGENDDSRVLSVVLGSDGEWYIDEVGRMTRPAIDEAGTPVVARDELAARATEIAATPVSERFPRELTLSIANLAAANESSRICEIQDGTPFPCMNDGLFRMGPWGYNELPAGLPFTLTFVNTSGVLTSIVSAGLDIEVALPAGQQIDVEVDADPGSYNIDFMQGDATARITVIFQPDTREFTMG